MLDADLQAALDRLPETFREAVWLRDVEDLSYQEIAEALSVPIGTVMSRISRGRKLLTPSSREAARRRRASGAPAREAGDERRLPLEPGDECRQIEALLPPFVDGAASAIQRDRVAGHLARCPACRRAVEAQGVGSAAVARPARGVVWRRRRRASMRECAAAAAPAELHRRGVGGCRRWRPPPRWCWR